MACKPGAICKGGPKASNIHCTECCMRCVGHKWFRLCSIKAQGMGRKHGWEGELSYLNVQPLQAMLTQGASLRKLQDAAGGV